MQECQRFWAEREQDLDWEVMHHLAGSSQPFESLINPTDPRFLAPGDLPLKIKAYCKETKQPVPRGPGPIIRCVLESLALSYRQATKELERLTGRSIERLHLLSSGRPNTLLHHFIANALQIPVVTGPFEAATIGNLLVQAVAFGQVKSLEEARRIVRDSFKFETIQPHAHAWDAACEQYEKLI
jgi:rhamnulokinase